MYTNSTNSESPAGFCATGGPLQVSFGGYVDPFGTWIQKALEAVGMKRINGFNTGKLIGSAYATLTINGNNAHRSSSESSFLQASVKNNTSPTIYKNTLAQRILFGPQNQAIGVKVTTAGTYGTPSVEYILSARKEVIVSAGAFQSPQLLMVSGIGPQDQLKKYGIPVLKDLPGVGQNMWDHALFGVSHRVNVPTSSAGLNDPSLAYKANEAFIEKGAGPLATFGAGVYGWEKLPEPYRSKLSASSRDRLAKTFPADWPEIEYLPATGYVGFQQNSSLDPIDGYNYASINSAIVSPLSRGSISIQSADMSTPPLISPRWLTDTADVELAIQAVWRQRQIWSYLNKQGLVIGDEILPGANVTTDAEILDYIQQSTNEVWHASATCKMGKSTDKTAVVDSHARVYGTSRLRVVDTSAFPFLPPGHPQATAYALAEKIADIILKALKT